MARLVSVGRRELTAAQHALEVYEHEMETGRISPEGHARILAAMERTIDQADLSDAVMGTCRAIQESGLRSRRARRALTEWTVIHGGLSPECDGVG
jgi:hypothetical protein